MPEIWKNNFFLKEQSVMGSWITFMQNNTEEERTEAEAANVTD